MSEFQVGDIVQAVGNHFAVFAGSVRVGDVGRVVDVDRYVVGVDWGHNIGAHSCDGLIADYGCGTYVAPRKLRLAPIGVDETDIPLPNMEEVL